MDLKKKQELIKKYIKRIKVDYPEDDKIHIDLEQFAQELVKLFAIPDVSKQRELLIAFCDSLNGYDIEDLAKSRNWLVVDKFLKSN